MGIVFGSPEAKRILEGDMKIKKRIENIQTEYKEALEKLDWAENELEDAQDHFDDCEKELREIELFAKRYKIKLED